MDRETVNIVLGHMEHAQLHLQEAARLCDQNSDPYWRERAETMRRSIAMLKLEYFKRRWTPPQQKVAA